MNTYKFLIAGCGTAGTHVARVAVGDGRGEVVGLFDPDAKAMAVLQREFPTASIAASFTELLESAPADVAVIAGPDHLHAEQAVQSASLGLHLLIEKPLATTMHDVRRIVKTVGKHNVVAMTDQTMRYVYPYRQMSEMAKTGEIGSIFFIQGDYVHDMWSYYSPLGEDYTSWRSDNENPQNILLGGGCHPIDLILWTVESPVEEVMCYSNKLGLPEFPADDCYLLSLRFENGAIAKVHVSSGCSGHGMGDFLEIYGTEGTLSKGKLIKRGAPDLEIPKPQRESVIGGHGWGASVIDFLDTLDGTMENPVPLDDGAAIVAVCDAALKSVRTGRPVKVGR